MVWCPLGVSSILLKLVVYFFRGFHGKQQLLYSPSNQCMQFWLNCDGATNEELEQYVSIEERTNRLHPS